MNLNIKICDICKDEAREDKQPDKHKAFGTFRLNFESYCTDRRIEISRGHLHICEACQLKVGIRRVVDESGRQAPSAADQLYDIIAEIVREAMQP